MYNQLSLLGVKLSEQMTHIETLKAKLEDKDQKLKLMEGEKLRLEESMLKVSQNHEELQVNLLLRLGTIKQCKKFPGVLVLSRWNFLDTSGLK